SRTRRSFAPKIHKRCSITGTCLARKLLRRYSLRPRRSCSPRMRSRAGCCGESSVADPLVSGLAKRVSKGGKQRTLAGPPLPLPFFAQSLQRIADRVGLQRVFKEQKQPDPAVSRVLCLPFNYMDGVKPGGWNGELLRQPVRCVVGCVTGLEDNEGTLVGDVKLVEAAGREQTIDDQLLEPRVADPGLGAEGLRAYGQPGVERGGGGEPAVFV